MSRPNAARLATLATSPLWQPRKVATCAQGHTHSIDSPSCPHCDAAYERVRDERLAREAKVEAQRQRDRQRERAIEKRKRERVRVLTHNRDQAAARLAKWERELRELREALA
ncbi:MAG TPA: hypothetical protein VFT98_20215 [Myxococcota bacterium]|nr:hypothetical protein [Myxococcota bacterium]